MENKKGNLSYFYVYGKSIKNTYAIILVAAHCSYFHKGTQFDNLII